MHARMTLGVKTWTKLRPDLADALTDVFLAERDWDTHPQVRVLQRAGRKTAAIAEVRASGDVRRVFAKVYRPRPGWRGLKEAMRRPSPGVALWHIGNRVRAAGIATPEPLHAGERRVGPFLDLSFFACEALDTAQPLERVVEGLGAAQRRGFAERLAERLAAASARGFAQSDLKPSNLFIEGEPETFEVVFVDLRRAAVGGVRARVYGRKTRRNLEERILRPLGFSDADVGAFFTRFEQQKARVSSRGL